MLRKKIKMKQINKEKKLRTWQSRDMSPGQLGGKQ